MCRDLGALDTDNSWNLNAAEMLEWIEDDEATADVAKSQTDVQPTTSQLAPAAPATAPAPVTLSSKFAYAPTSKFSISGPKTFPMEF